MKNFDQRVLEAVKKIPEGKVSTYKEIAHSLHTKAYRAVGQALRRNEHPMVIPCHRVVCSDGRIGGYAGRPDSQKKTLLLKREGIVIRKGRVDLKEFGFSYGK